MRTFAKAVRHLVTTCWQDAENHGGEYGGDLTQYDIAWILSHLHRKPTSDEWYTATEGLIAQPQDCYQYEDIPESTLDGLFFDAVRWDDAAFRAVMLAAKSGDSDAQALIVRTVTALDARDRMEYA